MFIFQVQLIVERKKINPNNETKKWKMKKIYLEVGERRLSWEKLEGIDNEGRIVEFGVGLEIKSELELPLLPKILLRFELVRCRKLCLLSSCVEEPEGLEGVDI